MSRRAFRGDLHALAIQRFSEFPFQRSYGFQSETEGFIQRQRRSRGRARHSVVRTPGGTLGLHRSVDRVGAIMLRHATKTLGARLTPARAAAVQFFHTSPVVESSLPRKNGRLTLSPPLHLSPRRTRGRDVLTHGSSRASSQQARRKSAKAPRLSHRLPRPRISAEVSEAPRETCAPNQTQRAMEDENENELKLAPNRDPDLLSQSVSTVTQFSMRPRRRCS